MISCACGCGEVITSKDAKGRPRRFISGHNARLRPLIRVTWKCIHCGKENQSRPSEVHESCCRSVEAGGPLHPAWKGGRKVALGYVYLWMPEHPRANKKGYVAEHILVAEEILGRPLEPNEQPHHINHNRADNRPENIQVLTRSDHMRIHQKDAFRARFGREPFSTDEERLAHKAAHARAKRREQGGMPRYPKNDANTEDGWVYKRKGAAV